MRRRSAWIAGIVAAACAATGACSTVIDLQPPPSGEGSQFDGSFTLPDATFEGGVTDGAVADGGSDVRGDAPADAAACEPIDADLADAAVATTWSPFSNFHFDDAGDTSWQYYILTPLGAHATDFAGGAFDGRYVYYVPNGYGLVLRYDTTQSFGASGAWSTFDTSTLSGAAQQFAGAVFDGRYVYFVPHTGGASYGSLVVRFDTKGTFGPGPAWTTFDTTTVPVPDGGEAARGFYGGTFDGRYVYLVPYYDGTNRLGRVARYDTLAEGGAPDSGTTEGGTDASTDAGPDGGADAGIEAGPPTFGNVSDWETFDLPTGAKNLSATGFVGAAFDGRYVYLVPFENTAGASGIVARFDTTKPLDSSWTFFDISNVVDPEAVGFVGGAFDGRYLYFVPHTKSKVARYDTAASFTSKSAWTTFDLSQFSQLDGGTNHDFSGAAFDGRFVYFMPESAGAIVRYDTLSPFASTCAWSVYDTSVHILPGATDYFGAVFDGRFLYFVPRHTLALRFDTKTPAWTPASVPEGGSFF